MSDIFKEIEQEIRRDDAMELWAKYQIPIYALVVVIVCAIAGWRYWDYRRQQAAESAGARYEAALQLGRNGKTDAAVKALREIGQGQGGYALLARFSAADAISPKSPADAAKAYDAIAADPHTPPLMQNLARLRAAMIHADDADPKGAEKRFDALAAPANPFHNSAREQLAILELARKDYAAAGHWLDLIVTDPAAPPALRARAESLQGLVAGSGPPPKPANAPASAASRGASAPAQAAKPSDASVGASPAKAVAPASNPAAP